MIRLVKSERQLPVSYNGPHRQLDFYHCWRPWLNNPWLNKLYKESVCYTERWYLELRKMILDSQWNHPLMHSITGDIELKTMLVKSTVLDGAMCRTIINDPAYPEYHISASVNLKKINRWCAFFVSLPDSLETLAHLNGQSRD
jgi:hypothetical protein